MSNRKSGKGRRSMATKEKKNVDPGPAVVINVRMVAPTAVNLGKIQNIHLLTKYLIKHAGSYGTTLYSPIFL